MNYYQNYELFEKNIGFTELKDRISDNKNKKKWRTSQNTEVLFLERCYRYLREGGLLAIVIPDGVLTNSSSQFVRDWLIEHFRILSIVSLPQHTFSHVKAGVKSSIMFMKKHPKSLTLQLEHTLLEIKQVVKAKKIADKTLCEEYILKLYKEEIFKYANDYEVLMFDVENVGYDATGKEIKGSELVEVSKRINKFISSAK